jgi:hypothetical protein
MNDKKDRPPAVVLFSGKNKKWHKTRSLDYAMSKSKEVMVMWDKGKESVYYLDEKTGDRTDAESIGG